MSAKKNTVGISKIKCQENTKPKKNIKIQKGNSEISKATISVAMDEMGKRKMGMLMVLMILALATKLCIAVFVALEKNCQKINPVNTYKE